MRGKVLVIGGAEDKNGNSNPFSNHSILERFIDETRLKKQLLPFRKRWVKNI